MAVELPGLKAWHYVGTWSPVGQEKKALEAEMRSSVIVMLFLFSMLFLGAQAAQLDPEAGPAEEAAAQPARHASADMLQPAGFIAESAD